ncbi:MAG: hypothetical protein LC774_15865 [Acidobacteria bacterium]|nr:hypothetical protein [Acidobacteriota bacterium]
MNAIADLVPTFLLNAAWQVTAVALVASACARLLREAPARLRHSLWVAALALSVALPLLGLAGTSSVQPTPESVRVFSTESAHEPSDETTRLPRAPVASAPAVSVVEAGSANYFPLARLRRQRRQTLTSAPALPLALAACYLLFLLFRVAALWRAWRRTERLRRSARALEVSSRLGAVAERCRAAFGLRRIEIRTSPTSSSSCRSRSTPSRV